MQPIEHIRKHIFEVSQVAFAGIAGTTQATVSRWERGELEPGRDQLALIREEALRRNINWSDQWFFDLPEAKAGAAA
jgi:transcriptional regulator with XRE-family HTH domain